MDNEDRGHYCVRIRYVSARTIAQPLSSPMETELLNLDIYEEHSRRKLGTVYLDSEDLYNNPRTGKPV